MQVRTENQPSSQTAYLFVQRLRLVKEKQTHAEKALPRPLWKRLRTHPPGGSEGHRSHPPVLAMPQFRSLAPVCPEQDHGHLKWALCPVQATPTVLSHSLRVECHHN